MQRMPSEEVRRLCVTTLFAEVCLDFIRVVVQFGGVLEVVKEERLVENAANVGTYLLNEIKAMNLPHVVDVRGRGLMIGVELDIPYKEPRTKLLFEEHCFTGCSGTNVLRLLPPLCLSMEDATKFLELLRNVLK